MYKRQAEGRIRKLRGMSARTEQKLLDGLRTMRARPPKRIRMGEAADLVARVTRTLAAAAGVRRLVPAGSFRRRRETVADLDILVETDQPKAVIERLHAAPWVERVGGHGGRTGGSTRTTVQLMRGPQLDRDEGQAQEVVDLFLGGEGAPVAAVEAREAVLG